MKLRMWYSVFGTNDVCPDPASFASALRPAENGLTLEFDSPGPWRKGTISFEVGRILMWRYESNREEFQTRMATLLRSWPSHMSQKDLEPVLAHLRRTVQMINFHPLGPSRSAKMARVC